MMEAQTVSFNVNNLKESAKNIASSHTKVVRGKGVRPIKPILADAKEILTDAYRVLSGFAKSERELSPAAEWLIDNFYIIQEQVVQTENDFPIQYQKTVPLILQGELQGLPRVYELILNYLTLTDNLADYDSLIQYVQSYQQIETLEQGEIWAIPIMIRLILIQKLAEKSTRILHRKKMKKSIEKLVSELDPRESREPGVTVNMLSNRFNSNTEVKRDAFYLVELYNQLQSSGNLFDEEKRWFNYRFQQVDLRLEEAMRFEAQIESRLQVSVQNAVISLRNSSEIDWSDFVEECSVIEKILRLDPAGCYNEMDFQTRDSYRRAVERLSRRSDLSETDVAEQVLMMVEEYTQNLHPSAESRLNNNDVVKYHVGYFLIGEGFEDLSKRVKYSMPLKERIHRRLEKSPVWYVSAVILHTIILMGILWFFTGSMGHSAAFGIAVLLVSLFPALDLSISAVNRFFAFFLPPRILPKMDFEEGIPDDARTMVVVPTMFSSPQDVRRQVENLEIRSLANPDFALQFVLLSDFRDSDQKEERADQEIIDAAKQAINELNHEYTSRFGDKFFFLHRERLWNASEEKWIGWERKRGKLEEFNRLIYDTDSETNYKFIGGKLIESLKKEEVRFIVTLDSDTKLPPDSARHLVRTIAHPLNRPWYNADLRRVTKGYGIIQPRISIPAEFSRKTWFTQIFSGNVGLDPYSTAVSDIYQDLTGEAIFTGKGIYDLEAFHKVLAGHFPENRILSHDLIESTYLRAGLATDIELFDDYPSTYAAFSERSHRWIRGDWQIASWLFSNVPARDGKEKNTINLLSKWKIFDNLRRSLNPFFLTFFFIAGWFLLPGSALIWTAAAFGILAFPIYVSLSSDILNRPARVRWKLYMGKIRDNLKINSLQAIFTIIILPHQAFVQLDAVVRTIYRLLISRKYLLEWTTASQTESTSRNSLSSYISKNIISVFLAAGILVIALTTAPQSLWIVIPFVILWGGAPVYLWYVSRPITVKEQPLSDEDTARLRIYARKTWFYFERLVNQEQNWLPPDNYQEDPPIPVAGRTSPTNIGMALVSTQVACNMGYITFGERLERILQTLHTLDKLEKFNGHFYNWYNTKLGEVLPPKYISTVDSGNLAASLIVVKQAVLQAMETPKINSKIWSGLTETLMAVKDIFETPEVVECLSGDCYEQIVMRCTKMSDQIDTRKSDGPEHTLELLKQLKEEAISLCSADLMPLGSTLDDNMMQNLLFWIESPLRMVEKAINEYKILSSLETDFLSDISVNEMLSLLKNDPENRASYDLLKQWKNQADEITYLCEKFIDEMDFSFLYLEKRGLFSIGYNVEKAKLDEGTYDLLASEARISSYIAIAKGDVPVEHWFRLSRRLTNLNHSEILLSWGGTMFEYLMPVLFMRNYSETLLSHTSLFIVEWQKEYGARRNKPWGFSESAYGLLNIDMHYQYRTFGAPGLGLKRGLAEEYVVAPYASMLSLMIEPKKSLDNLIRLQKMGGSGVMGFYDAIDFTPRHLKEGENYRIVKTYMVHHHGMSLIAIENLLNQSSVQNYFHSDPRIRGCELILQERIPRGVPINEPHPIDAELEPGEQKSVEQVVEHAGMNQLDATPPRLHMLGNGNFSMFMTHAGTGTSSSGGITLNGWDPDPTTDSLGFFFYIKDTDTGTFWSSMHQPVKRKPDRYDTWFHNGKIVSSRVDDWIETTTQVSVSPDHPIEIRKLTLTNYSQKRRTLEVTSYAEVVLNGWQDHKSHPTFSKLFLQTDYLNEHHSILVKRRPRTADDKPLWMVHTFAGPDQDNQTGPLQFETERSRFIGRGRSTCNPAAMDNGTNLHGTIGNVSDPIVSLRKKVILGPGEKAEFTFGLGLAHSRDEAVQLADIYDNRYAADRAFKLADVYSSVELNHIGISSKQAHYFQKLVSWILYPDSRYRADEEVIRQNRQKQKDLWAYGISGDLPLVVFRINKTDQLKHVRMMLKAHAFWSAKGVETELLFLNDHAPSYVDELQEAISQAIESSSERERMNKKGGIFIQRSDKISEDNMNLILTVAHMVFEHKLPNMSDPDKELSKVQSWMANDQNSDGDVKSDEVEVQSAVSKESTGNLKFFNEFGGFSENGEEYHIVIKPDPDSGRPQLPPAPWINVIANPDFGFFVTEKGSGYTWSENSRENKLTGWSNDPVTDPASEAFYIRDEDSGRLWSPTAGPAPGRGSYRVVHGFGYTRFKHQSEELKQELVQYVPTNDSAKISVLTIENSSDTLRHLSVYRYLEMVLGVDKSVSHRHIIQKISDDRRTIFSKNNYNSEFAGRTVFASVIKTPEGTDLSFTTNRMTFIGRNRSLSQPLLAESGEPLDNGVVVAVDPCVVFRLKTDLKPGERAEFIFAEGEAGSQLEATEQIYNYRKNDLSGSDFESVKNSWKSRLCSIQVETPEPSMDMLMNGWLMYQNLSCRMWGRTAFYQAGGAFGFRDQLQDSMAALYADAKLTRQQILLHAAHQFKEGDVLHWWHPPTGRGIRSKITDDRLWLPYVTDFYVGSTGDDTILDEQVPYITARQLEEYEHEIYLQPKILDEKESIYQHCCRAIDISLKFGTHGLPLIGAGDWNDGMNRIGDQGKGESVWLGFFIYDILIRFEKVCRNRDDLERADEYKKHASKLKKRLNNEGWDGEWYLRAFYDDGTPLGSSSNIECRIDAISQAWSVLSGAAQMEKGETALQSAEQILISEQNRLIRLLYPPFDQTEKDPGYIKGYIPGVRENGGQYTHGALWLIKAFAELGMGGKAVNYFNMINPVNHALNKEEAQQYKVEPYVVTADVYGEPPLTGMGGWSWYTGSGGWMYRVALESILGFTLSEQSFELSPSISSDWPGYTIRYRPDENGTEYIITVENPEKLEQGDLAGTLDGEELNFLGKRVKIKIKNDGKQHHLKLKMRPLKEA